MQYTNEMVQKIRHFNQFASNGEVADMKDELAKIQANKKHRQIRVKWTSTNMGGYYASHTSREFIRWLLIGYNNSTKLSTLENRAKELGLTIRLIK